MDLNAAFTDEFRRYRRLGDAVLEVVNEGTLNRCSSTTSNSIACLAHHVGGNPKSRFTRPFEEDGERPWRNRDGEFEIRERSAAEVARIWNDGWEALFDFLESLTEDDLKRTIHIRRQPHSVEQALCRGLAHTAFHVGQMVTLAKEYAAGAWRCMSIGRGASEAHNKACGM